MVAFAVPPATQEFTGRRSYGASDVRLIGVRSRLDKRGNRRDLGEFFIRHRLQIRVVALDASKDGIGKKALVVHLWNRGEFPQKHLRVKVTITEVRRATARPEEVVQAQIGLHYTGIAPKRITLGPRTFIEPDLTPDQRFAAGAFPGYDGPKEIDLLHGQRAAFLLAESRFNASKVRIHGSVAPDAHNHPPWEKYLAIGKHFEFGVTILARDLEKKKWVHIYRHYVVKFPSWDHPIVGWEWKDSWFRISTEYPEAPRNSHWYGWFARRVMDGVVGNYPGE